MLNKFMNELVKFCDRVIFRGFVIGMGIALLIFGSLVLSSNPIAGFWFMVYSAIFLVFGIFNLIKHEEDI